MGSPCSAPRQGGAWLQYLSAPGWQGPRATLTLPKLSAYSRYSEGISCTERHGLGASPLDTANPRTLEPAALEPTEGQGQGRCRLLPSQPRPQAGDLRGPAPTLSLTWPW